MSKRRRRGINAEQTPGPELRPLRSRSLERWKSGLRNLIVRSTFLFRSKKSKLRLQLLAMAENDQCLRWRALARDPGLVDTKSQRQMQALDERNTERLKRLLGRHGWPTRHAVGESAAFAAWLIVQHSRT